MSTFARWHDYSTELGARVAALCVAATACIYTAEVVARYFFAAPLNWSGDVSSYLLCACAFLALPMVTKSGGHVAIGYFLERMSEAARPRYARMLATVTALVCLATAEGAALGAAMHSAWVDRLVNNKSANLGELIDATVKLDESSRAVPAAGSVDHGVACDFASQSHHLGIAAGSAELRQPGCAVLSSILFSRRV